MVDDAPELPATMRAWRTHAYGPPLEALQLDEVPVPEPGPGEVLVAVAAIPLNLNDLERVTGGPMMVPPELPVVPGMEVVGRVVRAGEGAEGWLGQRVAAMPRQACGGFAEWAVCPAVATFALPESLELPEAAGLYFPFHLAWLGLVDRARLQAGETVLVHAGAGGSGSAAIQLAVHLGARVIAAAGGPAKVARCRELGAHVAVDYLAEDVAAAALEATGGRGVDVVFDNVGEAVFDASLRAIAYGGRYLMMGFASNKGVLDEPSIVPRRQATANVALHGVLLAYATDDVRAFVKEAMGWNFVPGERGTAIMAAIVELAEAGVLRPLVGQVAGFDAIPQALVDLAERRTVGRTVVLV